MCEFLYSQKYLTKDPISIIRDYLMPTENLVAAKKELLLNVDMDTWKRWCELLPRMIISEYGPQKGLWFSLWDEYRDELEDDDVFFNIEDWKRFLKNQWCKDPERKQDLDNFMAPRKWSVFNMGPHNHAVTIPAVVQSTGQVINIPCTATITWAGGAAATTWSDWLNSFPPIPDNPWLYSRLLREPRQYPVPEEKKRTTWRDKINNVLKRSLPPRKKQAKQRRPAIKRRRHRLRPSNQIR